MFAPTADQRNTVKIMAGLGVPQDKICLSVVNTATGKPVSEPTLRGQDQRRSGLATEFRKMAVSATFQCSWRFE
jgi:hypothetical protein